MIIRCWGSRGSIPVSGPEYLTYGGDTTCLEIRSRDDQIIIVDAGTGIRRLGQALAAEGRFDYHFLFTHAHWDHIMGFPFFNPIFNPRTSMHMHRCPFQSRFVETVLKRIMSPPHFPVKFTQVRATIDYEDACPAEFTVGSIRITPIALNHPNSGAGYRFEEDGRRFVFLTDNELGAPHRGGLSRNDYVTFCKDADLIIHDAEYTPDDYLHTRGWGHSTYTDALTLALDSGAARLGLFHHNQDRTDDQIDAIVADCRAEIKRRRASVICEAVPADGQFHV